MIRDERGTYKYFVINPPKELIKANGLQVTLAELEALLLDNGKIADAVVVEISRCGLSFLKASVIKPLGSLISLSLLDEFPRAYVVLTHGKQVFP
ncbi:hypothetical protein RBB50_008347 [Rhinocladiella similis]